MPPRAAPKKATVITRTMKPQGRRQEEKNIQEDFDHNDDDSENNDEQMNKFDRPLDINLEQDIARMMLPVNPQAPSNLSYYNFRDREWKKDELIDQLSIHFSMDGDIIHKESPEYQIQSEFVSIKESLINEAKRRAEKDDPGAGDQNIEEIKKQLRNKFNYSERQSQTLNEPIKERGVSTQPPPSRHYNVEINQSEIFDTYMVEFAKEGRTDVPQPEKTDGATYSLYSASFKRCLKVMERMTVQNEQQERYHDYKYFWTGETADLAKSEDKLYPIWRFSGVQQKKRTVTSICWNPKFHDLFAVSYGSYDFLKPLVTPGLICVFSLKNTTHPEYSFPTECGVMSIDFHPTSPALLAVGLYDGTVQVYDIRSKVKKAIYQSTVRTKKHTDPVWQVRWDPDTSKNYNFYSISSDGRVTNWILMKNKLEPEEIIKLKLVGKTADEESSLIGYAGGLCFDFNKFEKHVFLVGTEEGKIHKCSKAFSGQYLETYEGHTSAVYKVRWNPFHPRTFISSSADWSVKIWDSKYKLPIMTFDLGTQCVDALWAPYSSTVFAALTLEKIYVYDLSVDKYSKLAEQRPLKNPKYTNLAFNNRDPVILMGDSLGGVTLIKLNPVLTQGLDRVVPEEPADKDKDKGGDKTKDLKPLKEGKDKGEQKVKLTFEEYQQKKMEKLLHDIGKMEKDDV
jgi:dynein intermediate chain 1